MRSAIFLPSTKRAEPPTLQLAIEAICNSFLLITLQQWGHARSSSQFSNSGFQSATHAGAGGVTSLGSRGVTEDVELPKELTPVTSHSIAFVVPTLHRLARHSIG